MHMPKQERFKTKHAGVFYVMASRKGGKPNQTERLYYIRFKRGGKLIEEPAGRQYADDMTPAKAALKRANKIQGKEPTRKEKRQAVIDAERAKAEAWTIDRLWQEYRQSRKPGKSLKIDTGRYDLYIKEQFGDKEPKEILALDVERLKRQLLKKKSPQTVAHILGLLTWIIGFGTKRGLCAGLSFKIEKPPVNNIKTEDLTSEQLQRLLEAIEKDDHAQAGPMMLMALYSGLRRGEMFRLEWRDLDFDKGFIKIRDPKGGKDVAIPMNDSARDLLEFIPRVEDSPFVFPGRGGKKRGDINKQVDEIKRKAGLPNNFRPLHGLRHVFASMLASSGQVDMYTLQKLLTHKSPIMSMRYAHLRDETLRKAAGVADDIIGNFTGKEDRKIVKLEK
jgi:integrase